jgi:hypothetical protein
MKLPSRAYLRSVQGQLAVLGITFAGGVALAGAALLLRDRLFEPYAREKYPPLEGRAQEVAKELAGGPIDPKQREKLEKELQEMPKAMDAVYGELITGSGLDGEQRLARWLIRANRKDLLGRLRRTLVVGSPAQRAEALRFLGLLAGGQANGDVIELASRAREQARRRGEAALVEQADGLLRRLGKEREDGPTGS